MIPSAEDFVRLRVSEDPEDYRRATQDEASDAVWRDVIARFPEMRKWVAQNKTVPLSILAILAHDDDADVRSWVAQRRRLSAALFEYLSRDTDPKVRYRLCHNAKTPADIVARLATDHEPHVKAAALSRIASEAGQG